LRLAIWFVVLLPITNALGAEVKSADYRSIEHAIENWNTGWKIKDAALATRDYAEDADWTNAFGMQRRGRAEIQKMMEEVFRLPFVMGAESELADQTIRFVRPDVALVTTKVERRGQTTPSGESLGTRHTQHLRVFVRSKKGWQIVSHLISDARDPRSASH
jgi:uncharacterized protein (TIGR02246 family)